MCNAKWQCGTILYANQQYDIILYVWCCNTNQTRDVLYANYMRGVATVVVRYSATGIAEQTVVYCYYISKVGRSLYFVKFDIHSAVHLNLQIVNDEESLETTAHDVVKRVLPQLIKLYNFNGSKYLALLQILALQLQW